VAKKKADNSVSNERYRALIRLESASTGSVLEAGAISGRGEGEHLAPCSDEDINTLLAVGAIAYVPQEASAEESEA
jgi:hypothetical protein